MQPQLRYEKFFASSSKSCPTLLHWDVASLIIHFNGIFFFPIHIDFNMHINKFNILLIQHLKNNISKPAYFIGIIYLNSNRDNIAYRHFEIEYTNLIYCTPGKSEI